MGREDRAGGHGESVVAVLVPPLLTSRDELMLRTAATIRANRALIAPATLLDHDDPLPLSDEWIAVII